MRNRFPILGALVRDRRAVVGLALLAGFVLLAILGPLLAGDAGAAVDIPLSPPSWRHLLGTTGQGQDVLAQTIVGARATLGVGFAVGVLVTFIGVIVGVAAGYFGGPIDDAASVITNVFLVIPGLPLAIVLAAYLPPGPVRLAVVLVVAGWAWCARVFRAETLSLRQKDFVAAALLAGEPRWRIIAVEILPNMASLVAASFIGTTIYAIGAEVGLEFLGLGDLGSVSWGTNLYWATNDSALLTGAWWTFVPTGLCVALVGFALTLVSFALDEVTNPRLRRRARPRPLLASAATPVPTLSTASDALVSVRELRIHYPGAAAPAVDGLSLDLFPGEIFGLAGESGSGKSTLGHALLRLLPSDAEVQGEIRFGGLDVLRLGGSALRRWRWREASIVFQSAMSALNPVLTIGDQFADAMAAHGLPSRAAARKRARELLALVELDPRLVDAWPHQLSGGMRQRVGLALALALEPRLVVMDEPTTALDVVAQRQILERLVTLQRQHGFAILFITHDLPLLLSIAARIAVLRHGRVVEVASTERLRSAPRDPYTRLLLSSFPSLPPLREQRRGLRAASTPAALPPAESPATSIDRAPSSASGAAADALLSVRDVVKSFTDGGRRRPARRVLDGISLDVGPGEVVAVVGESGSGKSTLARLVAGLARPDGGRILIAGRRLGRAARVQMVFQDPFASLNPVHTIEHHLVGPLARRHRLPMPVLRERAAALLDAVGLSPALGARHPHALSGGQRQRVAIARALASEPQVILADEPTSMLDVSTRLGVLRLLRRLADERRLAILLITHDLTSAAAIADRVLTLYAGRVVEAGPTAAVLAAPAHPYTHLLLSAVPRGDRLPLVGDAPAAPPDAASGGCPFFNRCPHAGAACRDRAPALVPVAAEHEVRCHLFSAQGAAPHASLS